MTRCMSPSPRDDVPGGMDFLSTCFPFARALLFALALCIGHSASRAQARDHRGPYSEFGSAAQFAVDLGGGQLYFGDQDAAAASLRLSGEWISPHFGVGAELFGAGSFDDMGGLDGPGAMVRAFPYLKGVLGAEDGAWQVALRVGPEFQSLGAGDDLYFEYEGVGGRIAIDALLNLSSGPEGDAQGWFGRVGLGHGFGSGDAEGGLVGYGTAFVEDDTATFDVSVGVGYRFGAVSLSIEFVHQEIEFDWLGDSVGFDGVMVGITLRT